MSDTISKIEEVRLTALCCDLVERPGNFHNAVMEDLYEDPRTVKLQKAVDILLDINVTYGFEADLYEVTDRLVVEGSKEAVWVANTLREVLGASE